MSGRAAQTERRLSFLLLLVAARQRMGQLVDRELAAPTASAPPTPALLSLVGVRGPAHPAVRIAASRDRLRWSR